MKIEETTFRGRYSTEDTAIKHNTTFHTLVAHLLRGLVEDKEVALLGSDGKLGASLAPLQKRRIPQIGLELLNLAGAQIPNRNLAILVLQHR